MRLAALLLALLPFPCQAAGPPLECIAGISGAMYNTATTRYGHAVLGVRSEWEALTVFFRLQLPCRAGGSGTTVDLPDDAVFEDQDPILADLTGDGEPEVLTVESDRARGSRLTVWTRDGADVRRLASTKWIGQRHRWLAQVGAVDLDGDGRIEIAYVDRPHVLGRLRLLRLEGGALVPVAEFDGITNHVFGEVRIRGGIRSCDGGPEMIVASMDWAALLALRWDGLGFTETRLGTDTSPEAFAAAMECR